MKCPVDGCKMAIDLQDMGALARHFLMNHRQETFEMLSESLMTFTSERVEIEEAKTDGP